MRPEAVDAMQTAGAGSSIRRCASADSGRGSPSGHNFACQASTRRSSACSSPTRGGTFVENGSTYTLTFGAPRRLDLSGLAGHEVKVTLTHTEGVTTTIACEWQAQRGA